MFHNKGACMSIIFLCTKFLSHVLVVHYLPQTHQKLRKTNTWLPSCYKTL